MNLFKFIGMFLAVLLLIFMVKGMLFGAMMFFYVLKLIGLAVLIAGCIYLYYVTTKNRK